MAESNSIHNTEEYKAMISAMIQDVKQTQTLYMGTRRDNGDEILGSLIFGTERFMPGRAFICPSLSSSSYQATGTYMMGGFVEVDPASLRRSSGIVLTENLHQALKNAKDGSNRPLEVRKAVLCEGDIVALFDVFENEYGEPERTLGAVFEVVDFFIDILPDVAKRELDGSLAVSPRAENAAPVFTPNVAATLNSFYRVTSYNFLLGSEETVHNLFGEPLIRSVHLSDFIGRAEQITTAEFAVLGQTRAREATIDPFRLLALRFGEEEARKYVSDISECERSDAPDEAEDRI